MDIEYQNFLSISAKNILQQFRYRWLKGLKRLMPENVKFGLCTSFKSIANK
jgi:hypothetical protein